MANKPFISLSEVRQALGVSDSGVQKLVDDGQIRTLKSQGLIHYRAADVDKLLQDRKATTSKPPAVSGTAASPAVPAVTAAAPTTASAPAARPPGAAASAATTPPGAAASPVPSVQAGSARASVAAVAAAPGGTGTASAVPAVRKPAVTRPLEPVAPVAASAESGQLRSVGIGNVQSSSEGRVDERNASRVHRLAADAVSESLGEVPKSTTNPLPPRQVFEQLLREEEEEHPVVSPRKERFDWFMSALIVLGLAALGLALFLVLR